MTSQPYGTQPGHAPAQPQMSNPFSGIPWTDVLRDVAALILLFAALFYDWNIDFGQQMGAELWFVDVATVLAVLALVPSYLSRLGVFGHGWDVRHNGLIRLLATIPYFICVLVVVILDIADERMVGVGVAVGLFGALLVAQPRKHELPASHLAPSDRIWLYVTGGLLALAALAVLITGLLFIDDLDGGGVEAPSIVVYVVAVLLVVGALAFPAVLTFLAKPQGVALVAGLGLVWLVLAMLHVDGENITQLMGFPFLSEGFESVRFPGFGAFLVIAAAAAALSPGASRSTGGSTHPVSMVGAAKGAFLLIALTSIVHVLSALGDGLDTEFNAQVIITMVFFVLIAAVGALGFATTKAGGSKVLPLAAAGAFAVLVIVLSIILAIMDDSPVLGGTWLGALLVAAAIAIAVTGLGTLGGGIKKVFANAPSGLPGAAGGAPLPGAPQASQHQAPQRQAPQHQADPTYPAPGQSAPGASADSPEQTAVIPTGSSDPVVQRANDPSIDQAELAQIAQLHPHARAAVAQNPQAYPGLLDWLRQLGDPEVDAALARRQA